LLISRKDALAGIVSTIGLAGCAGSSGAGVGSLLSAGRAPASGTTSDYMHIVKTASAPRFTKTAAMVAQQTTVVDGYSFVTDPTNVYTNMYNSSGAWQGQFSVLPQASNGQPQFTANDGTNSFSMTFCNVATMPSNQWTTVGDFSVYSNSSDGSISIKYQTQTTTASYNASLNAIVVNFADGTSGTFDPTTFAEVSTSARRAHPAWIDLNLPGCKAEAIALAALVAAMIAAIAAFIACAYAAGATGGFWFYFCKISFDKIFLGIGALIAAATALLIADCTAPPPTPNPPATPATNPPSPPTTPPQTTPPSPPTSLPSPPTPSPSTPMPSPPSPHSPLPASPVPNLLKSALLGGLSAWS
jgi:hypothetical protein